MALLKKVDKKKPLRTTGGASATQASSLRPHQVTKVAPCTLHCPSATLIREWIAIIAQREKIGISKDEAFAKAWNLVVETNPFPSVMGRVCPHPCETHCNREGKDGAVAINSLERFIGDWGLQAGLTLPLLEDDTKPESIGVIGAGPAGLSFAYQLARRGYKVTVYESTEKAGGMLYWGIPFYRQPADILDKEIQRIVDLGVELKLNTVAGKDVSVAELKSKHKAIFLGIGAHKGKLLKIPGEAGPGVWTGTDFLHRLTAGEKLEIGKSVAIIGGGDTAIDAARVARRLGAEVTILYRRTRTEMPAIDSEVEDALKEGIKLELLVAPIAMKRDGDKVKAVTVQRMQLGEPDSSGRRRPVPIEGSEYDVAIDSLVAAVSQEADWGPLSELQPQGRWWLEPDDNGKIETGVWAGGDVVNLGLATIAIGQGRRAAEAVHAELRGLDLGKKLQQPVALKERIKMDVYEAKARAERSHRPLEQWLAKPDDEIDQGITEQQFLEEVSRCFSCGLCYGCERCWMFCTPSCFVKVKDAGPGHYYTVRLDICDGCKKCADECPCGFLDMQ
ncbi:MAG: FAD-dependent oxidoreductase [Deltaproteobacteria bacterium]|nr:FAD-dependent oxidoreductase [Deltaproteobacteria bacterium]